MLPILAVIAVIVFFVGKKSVSCGVMLALLAVFGIIVFIVFSSEITVTHTITLLTPTP